MKFAQSSIARPVPIDRNGVTTLSTSGPATVAPHAPTSRWAYTIPAGKKICSNTIQGAMMRETAAAPVGICNMEVRVQPSGGSIATAIYRIFLNNAVDAGIDFLVTPGFMLRAGDYIDCRTTDNSTGGTTIFQTSHTFTEYDA